MAPTAWDAQETWGSSMGPLRPRAPDLSLALLLLSQIGCGGGSSSFQPPPPLPPPQPDFSIAFSANSVNVQQGATSQAVKLSVNPLNGFTGTVQVSLTGLPAGALSNPPNPFSVAAGSSTPVLFSAATSASTGNSTIMAQGTSGILSHPASLETFTANDSAWDLGAAADGTMFALQANATTEIRSADFSLATIPANPELAKISARVQVPGVTLHPSGALVYQPFLTGPAGNAGVKGGVDILDAHSGALRLRILLPQQFMTDVDGLHDSFLATDENG